MGAIHHADDGASGAGYKAALVAGVRTYGWVADAVRAALEAAGLTVVETRTATDWVALVCRRAAV